VRIKALVIGVIAPLTTVLAACSNSPDAVSFCTAVKANQAALMGAVASPAEAAATVALFEKLGTMAPGSLRPDWETLTAVVRQAAAAPVGDAAARTAVVQAASNAVPAARAVGDYVRANCSVDLSPTTTAPAATVPPTTAARPTTTKRTTTTVKRTPTPTTTAKASGTTTKAAPSTTAQG
jgi:hypothetical protein